MATAPVVIPYALTQLAEGVSLNALLTTAQTIFTAPNGTKVVPMYIVFRDAAATVNAGTTFSLGTTANATAYLSGATLLQSFLTGTGCVFQPLFGSTIGTAQAYIPGGSVLTTTFAGTQTSNSTIKCDVLGYVTFT